MTPRRYDSKKVRAELDNLAGDDHLSVVTIPHARLTANEVKDVTDWQIRVLTSVTSGLPADLDLFPGLLLTSDTPTRPT